MDNRSSVERISSRPNLQCWIHPSMVFAAALPNSRYFTNRWQVPLGKTLSIHLNFSLRFLRDEFANLVRKAEERTGISYFVNRLRALLNGKNTAVLNANLRNCGSQMTGHFLSERRFDYPEQLGSKVRGTVYPEGSKIAQLALTVYPRDVNKCASLSLTHTTQSDGRTPDNDGRNVGEGRLQPTLRPSTQSGDFDRRRDHAEMTPEQVRAGLADEA
ncbi:hypothetical protein CLF_107664 [Clonorchis sinensis]|uniref:Uncharacterized protein n=1 Tax=Clonorchis sinensis TaxID=79923 RepID=G7YQX0_CLOSI|nr:hypothetical protein CLF_107664 [Clonorchis sinensis]